MIHACLSNTHLHKSVNRHDSILMSTRNRACYLVTRLGRFNGPPTANSQASDPRLVAQRLGVCGATLLQGGRAGRKRDKKWAHPASDRPAGRPTQLWEEAALSRSPHVRGHRPRKNTLQ